MDVSAFQKNNIVTFGHYEQDNDLNNGPEEIEWIVLDYDEKENKSLLLSRYGLDAKPYNETYGYITWENCTLRKWMNNEFLKQAFSEKEQDAVLVTIVDNSSSQGYSTWVTGGNNTQDQIFLLSLDESKRYYGDETYNTRMRVAPTVYAIAHGAKSSAGNQTDNGEPAGWWWLRSPGFYQAYAMYVSYMGSFRYADVNITRGVVRPALWLNLEYDKVF